MAVRVDTNAGESALFAALQARLGAEQVVRERLDVGDVVLKTDDGGTALVVERKTWADLASSLTDGRYAEQKARLLAVAAAAAPAAPSNEEGEEEEGAEAQHAAPASAPGASSSTIIAVLYVVEGALRGWEGAVGGAIGGPSRVKNAQLEAALVMTAVRDGIPVLRTKDTAHTVEVLVYLHGKLRAGELRLGGATAPAPAPPGNGGGFGYAALVKKRKRDNFTPAATWAVMLAQPVGMSARKAAAVAAVYPTMAALAAATEAELAAVRVPPARGGGGTSTAAAEDHAGDGGAAARVDGRHTPPAPPAAAAGRRLGPAVARTLVGLLR